MHTITGVAQVQTIAGLATVHTMTGVSQRKTANRRVHSKTDFIRVLPGFFPSKVHFRTSADVDDHLHQTPDG